MPGKHFNSQSISESSKKQRGYTPLFNFLLDVVMPLVSVKYPKYFQVLLVIWRKTVGWGKAGDFISLTQFQRESGSSRDTVICALALWSKVGLIRRGEKRGIRGTVFVEVLLDYDEGDVTSRIKRLVESSDWSNHSASTSRMVSTPLVEPVDTQKKAFKRNYRKKEGAPRPFGRESSSLKETSDDEESLYA
jgi:hypothetical protein